MVLTGTKTNIPEELLQAQEMGNVIFFCGAGISYDANLPVFDGLLKKTANGLGHCFSDVEKALLHDKKFDQLYLSLERAFKGNPLRVRRTSADILTPEKITDKSIAKHRALLKLATARDGKTRLVTTNYDSLFDESQKCDGLRIKNFVAPLLPVPKEYKWNGIVYLHGKLDKNPSNENLESLVLSSGDFGTAYLIERWASRFVAELFRNFVVCFVGYSANDVILKYMLDALSSEVMKGDETRKPVYAFSGCHKGRETSCIEDWDAKGVIAIPYVVSGGSHSELTSVLDAWARYHEVGRMDKSVIVKTEMTKEPDDLSPEGREMIARVRWALKDEIGAKSIPRLNDGLKIKWLTYVDDEMLAGETHRALLAWVGSMLNLPETLTWCVRYDFALREEDFNVLRHSLSNTKFDDNALEDVWRQYLSHDRIFRRSSRYFEWVEERKSSTKLVTGLRNDFRAFIRPTLSLALKMVSFRLEERIWRDYFDLSVSLGENLAYLKLEKFGDLLVDLVDDLTLALRDACEILYEFNIGDYSHFYITSLFDDRDYCHGKQEWYYLLILLKEAWLSLRKINQARATKVLNSWCEYDYSPFYRMVLWAMVINSTRLSSIATWLRDHHAVFGCDSCCRELFELFASCGNRFAHDDVSKLEQVVFASGDECASDYVKATCLERLRDKGASLSAKACAFLAEFESSHLDWKNRDRTHDGVSCYEDSFDVEDVIPDEVHIPDDIEKVKELFAAHEQSCGSAFVQGVSERFRERPKDSVEILFNLGIDKSYWPAYVWEIAFNVLTWREALDQVIDSFTVERVSAFPVDVMKSVKIRLSFWLQSVAKSNHITTAIFEFSRRFLYELDAYKDIGGTCNESAPFELTAEVIVRAWYATKPSDNSGLISPYRELFSDFMNGNKNMNRYARRILLPQLPMLFRVDRDWTFSEVLPRLSWGKNNEEDVLEAWNSAIMLRTYVPELMQILWGDFAELGCRYEKMTGTAQEWYSALLLHIAIHAIANNKNVKTLCKKCRAVIRELPERGRDEVMRHAYLRIQTAGERADAVWRAEVCPFLEKVWPGEERYATTRSTALALDMVVCLSSEFPAAVEYMRKWIGCRSCYCDTLHFLCSAKPGSVSNCSRCPKESVEFLSLITDYSGGHGVPLRDCLDGIKHSPNVTDEILNSRKFKQLLEMAHERPY